MYIAHFRESDKTPQSLQDHLVETAEIAKQFGSRFHLGWTCYLAVILHDSGKFSPDFQNYINDARNGLKVIRGSVDHASYGGEILNNLTSHDNNIEKTVSEIICNAIFSHHRHSGLLDYISGQNDPKSPYLDRTNKELDHFEEVKKRFYSSVLSEKEISELLAKSSKEIEQINAKHKLYANHFFFLSKLVYSCLLDADRTNTYLFEMGESFKLKNNLNQFAVFQERLENKFLEFEKGKKTEINDLRAKMALECLKRGSDPTDFYKLSIPTGGGKTFSSMRFALEHALKNHKQRIIYILPFTTIIEQNAQEIREVLKTNEILEHHSNVFFDVKDENSQDVESDEISEKVEKRQALLQDNWDAPIIFTTMVRFLEIAFGRGTRDPRRFHQLGNAVLIFDEIQALPPKTTYMFNRLIPFLKDYCNTTTLLCTATQPTLNDLDVSIRIAASNEIVPDVNKISDSFKRVEIISKVKEEGWKTENIVDFATDILFKKNNLLIVLNTKKAVLEVYQKLEQLGYQVKHLSTNMCSAHRTAILTELKKDLKNNKKIVCVTTALIEAGVDISFETVIRATAGLDSIAQAAGRCNRNGESSTKQPVYLINPVKEIDNLEHLTQIKLGKEITEGILIYQKTNNIVVDLLSPDIMKDYFKKYYEQLKNSKELKYPFGDNTQYLFDLMTTNKNRRIYYLNKYGEELMPSLKQSADTIARNFNVIDQAGVSLLVPYNDEAKNLIADLTGSEQFAINRKWFKKTQKYTINIYNYQLDILKKEGLVYQPRKDVYTLNEIAYSEQFGLNIDGDSSTEGFVN